MDLVCRLCSSKEFLLSMFAGHNNLYRDYIRKIIYDTTDIKIAVGDKCKCVCLNCCIMSFNFYQFRNKCITNEEKLKGTLKQKKLYKIPKLSASDIDKIELPPTDILYDAISTWLASKKNNVVQVQEDFRNSNKGQTSCSRDIDGDNSSEYSEVELDDVSTQTGLIASKPMETQTDTRETAVATSQTESCSLTSIGIQTDITKSKEPSSAVASTQTEHQVKTKRIQTTLTKHSTKLSQTDSTVKESCTQFTQTATIGGSTCSTNSQTDHNLSNSFTKFLCSHKDSIPQTELKIRSRDAFVQTEELHTISEDGITSTNSTETSNITDNPVMLQSELASCMKQVNVNSSMGSVSVDRKDRVEKTIIPLKLDIKETSNKVISITGNDQTNVLNIHIDNHLHIRQETGSAMSPKLLPINHKTQQVEICSVCDKPIYSKRELKKHLKLHMQCTMCKLKFRSWVQTRKHMDYECKFRNITNKILKIPLVKVEGIREFVDKYSRTFEDFQLVLRNRHQNKQNLRPRSKSICCMENITNSSVDYSDRNNLVLRKLVTGCEKSTQTVFYDSIFNLKIFYDKLNLKHEVDEYEAGLFTPKKRKLLQKVL